jgi:biopolymer transport protein ExbB
MDAISVGVLTLLILMSVGSWYYTLMKAWRVLRIRREFEGVIRQFWEAPSLAMALGRMQQNPENPFARVAEAGAKSAMHHAKHAPNQLGEATSLSEFITRALRQAISHQTAQLETGLTFLASVGATAPFVGLFGTVWGIFHALTNIGRLGQASLETVAGPVGEALIMTAVGLFVAIPAVFAYNTLVRSNRIILADLDSFAHDLHAYFITGARVDAGRSELATPVPRVRAEGKSS